MEAVLLKFWSLEKLRISCTNTQVQTWWHVTRWSCLLSKADNDLHHWSTWSLVQNQILQSRAYESFMPPKSLIALQRGLCWNILRHHWWPGRTGWNLSALPLCVLLQSESTAESILQPAVFLFHREVGEREMNLTLKRLKWQWSELKNASVSTFTQIVIYLNMRKTQPVHTLWMLKCPQPKRWWTPTTSPLWANQ